MSEFTSATAPAVTTFQFHTHTIRIVQRDGEPWFIASDVAAALGYRDASNAARCLADHQKGTHNLSTLGGAQSVTIVNESGLYRLVLRSRKPEALAFSDWVTGEVLPSIRKTGGYGDASQAHLAEFRSLAHAAGLAVEREIFSAFLRGERGPKAMAWVLEGYGDAERPVPSEARAKLVDPFAFATTIPQLTEGIATGERGAGVSTADLVALAAACLQRVGSRERNRPKVQALVGAVA